MARRNPRVSQAYQDWAGEEAPGSFETFSTSADQAYRLLAHLAVGTELEDAPLASAVGPLRGFPSGQALLHAAMAWRSQARADEWLPLVEKKGKSWTWRPWSGRPRSIEVSFFGDRASVAIRGRPQSYWLEKVRLFLDEDHSTVLDVPSYRRPSRLRQRSERNPHSTGYVAAKIRANTARRNAGRDVADMSEADFNALNEAGNLYYAASRRADQEFEKEFGYNPDPDWGGFATRGHAKAHKALVQKYIDEERRM
jgi:hypothetical protein